MAALSKSERSKYFLTSRWMKKADMPAFLQLVRLGDVICIKRRAYYHTVVCVEICKDTINVAHLTNPDDTKNLRFSSSSIAAFRSVSASSQLLIGRRNPGDIFEFVDLSQLVNDKERFRIDNSVNPQNEPKPSSLYEIFSRIRDFERDQESGKGKQYDVLTFNCGHFTTWCRYGIENLSPPLLKAADTLKDVGKVLFIGGKVLSAVGGKFPKVSFFGPVGAGISIAGSLASCAGENLSTSKSKTDLVLKMAKTKASALM